MLGLIAIFIYVLCFVGMIALFIKAIPKKEEVNNLRAKNIALVDEKNDLRLEVRKLKRQMNELTSKLDPEITAAMELTEDWIEEYEHESQSEGTS